MATFLTSNLPGVTIAQMLAAGGTTTWSTGGFVANTVNVALYATTPDSVAARDDTYAHNVYLAVGGQWVTANESTGTGYTAGGSALPATKSITETAGLVTAKTTTTTLAWTITGTLSATFGCLIYDNTATTKFAYCWNYFGGSQTVTGGTFTITWNAAGLYTITIT